MREFKFRAFIDGVMRDLVSIEKVNEDEFIVGFIMPHSGEKRHAKISAKNIMQFIGRNDKNGVEIFEGDIVKERFFPIGENKDVIEYYFLLQVMPWRKAKIRVEGRTILDESRALSHHSTMRKRYQNTRVGSEYPCSIEWTSTKNIEVIGNIYENGDLLEGCTGLACN